MINFAAADDALIDETEMKTIENGINLYIDYLKSGVARDVNLDLVKNFDGKIVVENVGGSAYKTLSEILKKLGISDKFAWMNTEEDPFFHSIGKYDTDKKEIKLSMTIP